MEHFIETMEKLNSAMGINIFGIKENEFAIKLTGKDCICSHCPKELYLNCVNNWKVGNSIGMKYEEPYFYFCPLNLALGIVPVSSLDEQGGVDYFCIGPVLIKDLNLDKQYIPKDLKSFLQNAYIPKQMKVLDNNMFENYVWISYLSLLGAGKIDFNTSKIEHISSKEKYIREKSGMEIQEKSVSFFENTILNQIEAGNRDLIIENLNELIKKLRKEKGTVYRLAQIYYLFINKAIELGVHKEYAQHLNSDFLYRMNSSNSEKNTIDEWIKGVLSLVALVADFNSKQSLLVIKTKKYIENHFKENLTLKDVAKELDISYNYLSNLFNQEMTSSFSGYLHKCRIDEGKRLLVESNLDLVTISFEIGFSSQSYFSKVFKKIVRSTPGEYRRHYSRKK